MTTNHVERKKRTCAVPMCYGKRFDLAHRFPTDKQRADKWLKALDIPDLYKIPYDRLHKSIFICTQHFRDQDYKNIISRHLNKTAVPCINLKSFDEVIITDRGCIKQRNTIPGIRRDEESLKNPLKRNACSTDDLVESAKRLRDNVTIETSIIIEADTSLQKDDLREDEIDSSDKTDINFIVEQIDQNLPEENLDDILPIENVEEEGLDEETSIIESDYEAEMGANTIELLHPDDNHVLSLDMLWLRDHCRCKTCYNHETFQRRFNILDLPLDVKPVNTEIHNELLYIKWSDGHESEYDFDFLYKTQLDYVPKSSSNVDRILWDVKTITQLNCGRVTFNNFLTDDSIAKSVVQSLVEFGVAFIENVPPNAHMTEAAIRRLFPIQKTFFGEMWTFSDEKDHSDTAYSHEYLGAHTDNTYFNDPAGLQVLHCIKHTGTGGETFLVDGFKALNDFKKRNPKAYDKFTKIDVPAEYIENGAHYTYSAPIIQLNSETNEPERIRYNVYDRSIFNTIPQSEMFNFYRDFRDLAKDIDSESNQWRFKLNPGTVLIFDNWRVLHGREKYTGKRQLSGCYVSRCEFLNTARVMGLIS